MDDSTMVPMETRQLTGPTATEFEELSLILADLQAAQKEMTLFFDEYIGKESPIGPALFNSAIVRTASCFHKTEQHKLRAEEVFSSIAGWEKFMQWIFDLRNAHVAHSFGPTRQAVAQVFINVETGAVDAVAALMMRFVSPDPRNRHGFLTFISTAVSYANKKIEEVTDRLLAEAQALTREELDKLDPEPGLTPPASHQIRTSRSKFGKQARAQRAPKGPEDSGAQKPESS